MTLQLIFEQHNMGLNCAGSPRHGFFSIANTSVPHNPWLVESSDAEQWIQRNHRERGPTVSYTWIFNYVEG